MQTIQKKNWKIKKILSLGFPANEYEKKIINNSFNFFHNFFHKEIRANIKNYVNKKSNENDEKWEIHNIIN